MSYLRCGEAFYFYIVGIFKVFYCHLYPDIKKRDILNIIHQLSMYSVLIFL